MMNMYYSFLQNVPSASPSDTHFFYFEPGLLLTMVNKDGDINDKDF